MLHEEKLRLLKALHVLAHIPERQLASLAEFLRPKPVADGTVIFEEGSWGMSLYFVSSGQVRITTRIAGGSSKDLAILGAGEFFGETALVEEVPRAAGAVAVGPCLLFELFRGDLNRWVKSNPQQAVLFFAELVQVQSQRLCRTSGELALFFELFGLLGDPKMTARMFAAQALEHLLPRLEGSFSMAVYLREGEGRAMGLAASKGAARFEPAEEAPSAADARSGWLDASTFRAWLREPDPLGCVVFRSQNRLSDDARVERARTMTAVARFMTSAIETLIRGLPSERPT